MFVIIMQICILVCFAEYYVFQHSKCLPISHALMCTGKICCFYSVKVLSVTRLQLVHIVYEPLFSRKCMCVYVCVCTQAFFMKFYYE